MYVFVVRCIAYPFNARQSTDRARRHARVNKQDLEKIKEHITISLFAANALRRWLSVVTVPRMISLRSLKL